jgi:Tol biopolymer transport system component
MKPWVKTLLFASAVYLAAEPAWAQFSYIPYYGKNKIVYGKFAWKTYPTEHFRIYFYSAREGVLKDVAELAESAYRRISQMLKHQIAEPVPLIYYSTYTDFEQTNLFEVSEGILGVSEPTMNRIGIHGDMPLDDLQTLIDHELTHIFEFDILWGDRRGAFNGMGQPPLWVFEGLSEYATKAWTPWSALIVRDAILNDRVPEFTDSGEIASRYPLPREPAYDFGHSVYEFIEAKYGPNSIREFWLSLKSGSAFGKRNPLQRAFKIESKPFQQEWKKYLRLRNQDFVGRENPENYSITLGPEYPVNPFYFAFSNALSPSGDIVASLTFNARDLDLDLVLISAKDGSIIRNLTRGYTLRYEHIKYEVDPSLGRNLAWSPDGDKIAFFARDGQRHSLVLVDALSGKILKKLKLGVDQPTSPAFLPPGDKILFAAFDRGRHDLLTVGLEDGKIENLSRDEAYQKAPDISPDGKWVSYTIRVNGYDKLFISPLGDLGKRTQLTFGDGNTISPRFSADSREIFYSGDARGAYNLYSLGLETHEIRRFTDVRTGNFFPEPVPGKPKTLVFSSFNKGAFQIFKAELEGTVEGTVDFVELKGSDEIPRFKPALSLDISEDKIETRRGIGKLRLASMPPIDTVVSSDGSIYGGSTIVFTDILGDHAAAFTAYQVRSYQSFNLSYINLKRRFQYMISAFQYGLFYYPGYYYYDPGYYAQYYTYQDAIATRKISGIRVDGYYPFSRYYRAEAGFGYARYEEEFLDMYSLQTGARRSSDYFWNGDYLQASLALIGETTFFKDYGPASGATFMLSVDQGIPVSKNFFSNTNLALDGRKYFYFGGDALLAFRFEGFASLGKNPYFNYFGGNNQVRSSHYFSLIGTEGWYANAEFRFPLIHIADTVLGRIGPLRGVFFADVARTKIKGTPAKIWRSVHTGDSWELKSYDAIGSYGYGIEFFFLGIPLHIEFVKALHIPDFRRPLSFEKDSGMSTKFWIGFDF